MEEIKELVKRPTVLAEAERFDEFKQALRSELEKLTDKERRIHAFELVIWACSLAELYFKEPKSGEKKKRCVVEALMDQMVESRDILERMVEIALKPQGIVKKSWWKSIKLFFKRVVKEV